MADIQILIDQIKAALPPVTEQTRLALAPSGTLRAGINLSNFLLVTSKSETGAPIGVSPSIAGALADLIGAKLELITFDSPGEVADAARKNGWDIGNIGADPARAEFITFTDAYCEIESTCLVPAGSAIRSFTDVDRPGIKVATKERAAYTLWLERNLKQAELLQFSSVDAAFDAFVIQKMDVLAGLRPRLLEDAERIEGARVLKDRFAAVQQAIGTPSNRDPSGAQFLQQFVDAAKSSGLVEALIEAHGVAGKLSVAKSD